MRKNGSCSRYKRINSTNRISNVSETFLGTWRKTCENWAGVAATGIGPVACFGFCRWGAAREVDLSGLDEAEGAGDGDACWVVAIANAREMDPISLVSNSSDSREERKAGNRS